MSENSPIILMIDDDEHDVFLAKRIFAKHSKVVELYHSADAEAIFDDVEKIKVKKSDETHVPDFILLDINMPKVSGLLLLRRIKDSPVYRKIPIIVFTTSDVQEHVDLAYAIGASAYMVKPTAIAAYETFVKSFLDFWCGSIRRPDLTVT
ncbi:two-component system response regulator [Rhodoblastus acidophilus]|uniref:response regulator n=1 Tax=Rhodoblastus acidophilus TaxID=1074 RepID=UPI00160C2662|nr:response regulator [Rhodoblastus acidophilus]MCW2286172.1 two-component system response regulator [Rhodoblastus acidophilus]MCW2335066.1 two-component system response regulator [Rhodoblastus acidophilus]